MPDPATPAPPAPPALARSAMAQAPAGPPQMTPGGDTITAENYDRVTLQIPNEDMSKISLRVRRRAAYKRGNLRAEMLLEDPYDRLWLQWWNIDPLNENKRSPLPLLSLKRGRS